MIFELSLQPIDAKAIAGFEANTGLALPADYKDFLLQHNGGRPEPGVFDIPGWGDTIVNDLFGIGEESGRVGDLLEAYDAWFDRIPAGFVVIGDDPAGNPILLATASSGEAGVYFFDHEEEPETPGEDWRTYGNITPIAPSFTAFLGVLRDELPLPAGAGGTGAGSALGATAGAAGALAGASSAAASGLPTGLPATGMTEAQAEAVLGARVADFDFNGTPMRKVERADGAVIAWCDRGKVNSVQLKAPFADAVRGVRIGDTKSQVRAALGAPDRTWPVPDGRDRWFYEGQGFFRVDFARDADAVEFIYL